jgi:leader peptidase (prepilin peptidase)/N-methyltransferase
VLPHLFYILFVFAIGSCVGSFLNVVVWRLPRIELPQDCSPLREFTLTLRGLSDPPSHCPKCDARLKWYDNLPIVGWIKLGGRCRFCRAPISPRYPIVEAVTALIFVGYYVAFYMLQWRTCCPRPLTVPAWELDSSWPIFGLYVFTVAALLAASLIDAELYIIPAVIPWTVAVVGLAVHAVADRPWVPGSLNLSGALGPTWCALSAGGAAGLATSMALWWRGVLPTSFPDGEPLLDVDREAIAAEEAAARAAGELVPDQPLPPAMTFAQIRGEIGKEMLFLLPPLALAGGSVALAMAVPAVGRAWGSVAETNWVSGMLGALLGAMVGGLVPWVTRILGTLGFRRVAMGLGDVHLMFGVGAVVGAGGATVAFFVAPVAGLVMGLYLLLARRRRELPFGPYLSLATATVMLCYCPIAAYLTPGLRGLAELATGLLHGGGGP